MERARRIRGRFVLHDSI